GAARGRPRTAHDFCAKPLLAAKWRKLLGQYAQELHSDQRLPACVFRERHKAPTEVEFASDEASARNSNVLVCRQARTLSYPRRTVNVPPERMECRSQTRQGADQLRIRQCALVVSHEISIHQVGRELRK